MTEEQTGDEKELKLTDLCDSIPTTSEDLEDNLSAYKIKDGRIYVTDERFNDKYTVQLDKETFEVSPDELMLDLPPGIKTGIYESVKQIQKAYGTLQFAIEIAIGNLSTLKK